MFTYQQECNRKCNFHSIPTGNPSIKIVKHHPVCKQRTHSVFGNDFSYFRFYEKAKRSENKYINVKAWIQATYQSITSKITEQCESTLSAIKEINGVVTK